LHVALSYDGNLTSDGSFTYADDPENRLRKALNQIEVSPATRTSVIPDIQGAGDVGFGRRQVR
jgi:hypothetical protein